jgi:hypothetical protein
MKDAIEVIASISNIDIHFKRPVTASDADELRRLFEWAQQDLNL